MAPPAGEAPLPIREAWVGLVLPLKSKFQPKPHKAPGFGVLTGPKSVIGQLFSFLIGRTSSREYYAVDPLGAIEVLRRSDAYAADWWETNVPHVLKKNRTLAFEAEVCELVAD